MYVCLIIVLAACLAWRLHYGPVPVRSEYGIRVHASRHIRRAVGDIGAHITTCVDVFSDAGLWNREEMISQLGRLRLVLLPSSSYVSHGRHVMGHVSGHTIVLAMGGREVHQSALAHELAHFFELHIDGHTDGTHESWYAKVYPAVEEANRRLEAAWSTAPS